MKHPHFLIFSLVAVIFLVSCSPTVTPAEVATSSDVPAITAQTAVPLQSGTDPQPVATSRGPDLIATDPTTVSLASGGLQLVEFFRFT